MAKKLRFTINDGDAFPIALMASAITFGKKNYSLNKRVMKGLRQNDADRRVDILLSQEEQTLVIDETLCLRHLGHALLVQKGADDNQTLWLDGIKGFPPAISIRYGLREYIVRDGEQVFIYPDGTSRELIITLPTTTVYFRVSKMWKAEVIG